MAEIGLKEILLKGDYRRLKGYHITQDDVLDFYNLYAEFKLLEDEYQSMTLGRKEAAKSLVERLTFLEEMSNIITTKTRTRKNIYEEATSDLEEASIKDYNKLFEVLRILASTDTTQYGIKTFEFLAYDSSERHGYRTDETYTGVIAILAESESLARLEESITGTHITKERLLELYQQGYSMVLTGNDDYMSDCDLPNKHALGNLHPIVFYLQDDELAKAATAFLGFVAENGADIDGIEVADLVKVIKASYQKTIDLK